MNKPTMDNQALISQVLDYCAAQSPKEACGLVVKKDWRLRFVPCRNIAADPHNHFEISPYDYIHAEELGEPVIVVHSHPLADDPQTLSLADRQMMLNSGLDWWLVAGGKVREFRKILPLVGREFKHGVTDCYSVFRDFYFLAGADFPDFYRAENWWESGENLYLDNMAHYGFERLADDEAPQIGDVVLIQHSSRVPNHAAVYVGDQFLLHHSPKRLSKRDLFNGYWLKHKHSIWRYKQWSMLDFTVPLKSLGTPFP